MILIFLLFLGLSTAQETGISGIWYNNNNNISYTTLTPTVDFENIGSDISFVSLCGTFLPPETGIFGIELNEGFQFSSLNLTVNGQYLYNYSTPSTFSLSNVTRFINVVGTKEYNLVLNVLNPSHTLLQLYISPLTSLTSSASLIQFTNGTCFNPNIHLTLDELVTVSNASSAYSFIRLTQSYSGPLIQVTGQNSVGTWFTQDVSYDSSSQELNSLIITSFVNNNNVVGNVFVSKWYDQSGLKNDLIVPNVTGSSVVYSSPFSLSITSHNANLNFNRSLDTKSVDFLVVYTVNSDFSLLTNSSNNNGANSFPQAILPVFINETFPYVSTFEPFSVAVDSMMNIYMADINNARTIRYYYEDFLTKPAQAIALNQLQGSLTYGVAVDSHDNIFVSNTYLGAIYIFAPDGITFLHNLTTLNPMMSQQNDLFIDTFDNIFVADGGNLRIVKFWANYSYATSYPGYQANGLAVDVDGFLYVPDLLTNAVYKLDPVNGTVVASSGHIFSAPNDVTLNYHTMTLYVPDAFNNRLVELAMNDLSTVSIITQLDLNNPRGVMYVPSVNHLIIGDTANQRILVVNPITLDIISIITNLSQPIYVITASALFPPQYISSMNLLARPTNNVCYQNQQVYTNLSLVPVALNVSTVTLLSLTPSSSYTSPVWNNLINVGSFYSQIVTFSTPSILSTQDQLLLYNYTYGIFELGEPNQITNYPSILYTIPIPINNGSSSNNSWILILEILLPIIGFLLIFWFLWFMWYVEWIPLTKTDAKSTKVITRRSKLRLR